MEYNILGIIIRQPKVTGEKLQDLFLQFGCIIKTRLGLNREEINEGIIILDLNGDQHQIELFINKLDTIKGIEYRHIKL